MMDCLVRASILLAEAALGVTIDDLIAESSSDAPGTPGTGPTVAEYVDTVTASFSKGTAATDKSYWRRLIDRLGERPIGSVGVDDCEAVVVDAIERVRRNRPGSDGRSACERCIGALRAVFARAERADLVTRNPAAQLEKPRRLPNRRRALDDGELREVIEAVRTTSQDPDLDLLIIRFHLESGARREGALNLRLRDLDKPRSTAWLREKFGIERRTTGIAVASAGTGDALLQSGGGHGRRPGLAIPTRLPITRRRYNKVFDRARPCLPWAERTPVSALCVNLQ
jgi:integrase